MSSSEVDEALLEEGGLLVSLPSLREEEDAPLLDKVDRPRFEVLHNITIRADPDLDGERTGDVLKKGTVFEGHDIVTSHPDSESKKLVHWPRLPLDEICYVSLGKGQGWAINRNPLNDERLLERTDVPPGIESVRLSMVNMFLGKTYNHVINFVIIFNAVVIYLEIDHHDSFSEAAILGVTLLFSALYLLEVVLKLFAFGIVRYFEVQWNSADFVITMATLFADVVPALEHAILHHSSSPGWMAALGSIAPVARLLRLLRLAKVFKELASLLESFVRSILALFWIALLMGLWFFICACVTTGFLGNKAWMPDGAFPEAKFLRGRFSSIPRSCFALLEVMTLEGWPEIVRPLMHHAPAMMAFFIVFIFITAFVLLNLVTAVVVENALAAQEKGKHIETAANNDHWGMVLCDLRSYFRKLSQGETRVPRSQMEAWLDDPGVRARLDVLGWDEELVLAACSICDTDNSGYVNVDDVTDVMSGTQRPLAMTTLLRMTADLAERMEKQDQLLENVLLTEHYRQQQQQQE